MNAILPFLTRLSQGINIQMTPTPRTGTHWQDAGRMTRQELGFKLCPVHGSVRYHQTCSTSAIPFLHGRLLKDRIAKADGPCSFKINTSLHLLSLAKLK